MNTDRYRPRGAESLEQSQRDRAKLQELFNRPAPSMTVGVVSVEIIPNWYAALRRLNAIGYADHLDVPL
jgi:hypothetical protein